MDATLGNGAVALARAVCATGGDAGNFLIGEGLVKQYRQHRRMSDVASGDLNDSDLECVLIDPKVDLALYAALGPAILTCIPHSFAFDVEARAVDQEVRRPLEPPLRSFIARVF